MIPSCPSKIILPDVILLSSVKTTRIFFVSGVLDKFPTLYISFNTWKNKETLSHLVSKAFWSLILLLFLWLEVQLWNIGFLHFFAYDEAFLGSHKNLKQKISEEGSSSGGETSLAWGYVCWCVGRNTTVHSVHSPHINWAGTMLSFAKSQGRQDIFPWGTQSHLLFM